MCHKEEDKPSAKVQSIDNIKRSKKKVINAETSFFPPKDLKKSNMNPKFSQSAKILVVETTENETNVENESMTSSGGVKDQITAESELLTERLSTRENIFIYDVNPQLGCFSKRKARAKTGRKIKQVRPLHESRHLNIACQSCYLTTFQTREHVALCLVVLTFLFCHSMRFLVKLYQTFIIDDYLNEER